MAEVPLVDLEVIVRYSLAIRQEMAPAEEVLAALDESRALVLALIGGPGASGLDEPGTGEHEDPTSNGRASAPEEDAGDEAGEDSPRKGWSGRARRGQAEEAEADEADEADQEDGGRDDLELDADGASVHEDEDADEDDELEAAVAAAEDDELEAAVAAAQDLAALDDLAGSGDEVDGTRGLDPEPAPVRRPSRLGRTSTRRRADPPPARTAPPAGVPQGTSASEAAEEDQAWVDEVERIRLRRVRKARQEAEERQARQAVLADEDRRAKRAERARAAEEAREAEEARRVQQALRAERGARAERRPQAADVPKVGREPRSRTARRTASEGPKAKRQDVLDDELDDVLELPPPLPADEAARRREERRRRRTQT